MVLFALFETELGSTNRCDYVIIYPCDAVLSFSSPIIVHIIVLTILVDVPVLP